MKDTHSDDWIDKLVSNLVEHEDADLIGHNNYCATRVATCTSCGQKAYGMISPRYSCCDSTGMNLVWGSECDCSEKEKINQAKQTILQKMKDQRNQLLQLLESKAEDYMLAKSINQTAGKILLAIPLSALNEIKE